MPTNWTSYDVDRAVFENFAKLQGCANDHIVKSRLWSELDRYSKYGPYDASWERPKPWTAEQTADLEHQLHMRLRKRRDKLCIFHPGASWHWTSTCSDLVHGDLSTAEIVSELRRHGHCLCCLEKHADMIKCGGRCLEPDCSNPDTHHVRLHWAFVNEPSVAVKRSAPSPPTRVPRLTGYLEPMSASKLAPPPDRRSKTRPCKLKKTTPTFVRSSLPVLMEMPCTPLSALSESPFAHQLTPSEEPTSPKPDLPKEQYSPQDRAPSGQQSSSHPDLSERQPSPWIELSEEKHAPRSELSDEQSEAESAYLTERTVDSDPSAPSGEVEQDRSEVLQKPESNRPEPAVTVESPSSARPDPPDIKSTAVGQSETQPASTADEEQSKSEPRTVSTGKVLPQPVPEVEVESSWPRLDPTSAEEPEQSLPQQLVHDVRPSSRPDFLPVADDQSACPILPAAKRNPSVSPAEHAVDLHQSTQSHLARDKSSVPTHESTPTSHAANGLSARRTGNQPQHSTRPRNSQINHVPRIGWHERIASSGRTFVTLSEDFYFWRLKSGTLILRLFRIGASYLPA